MNKVTYDPKFDTINEAVCYWLGYQFKIGRKQFVHEASLRYPIADSLTALDFNVNQIVLEQLHPIFKSKKIDLVIYNKSVAVPEDEKNDNNLVEVYEFKIAKVNTGKDKSDEQQAVFDDIVRLAYYNKWKNKTCYFLMCGTYSYFNAYFVGDDEKKGSAAGIAVATNNKKNGGWKAKGVFAEWFAFKKGEEQTHEFVITDSSNKDEWGLNAFKESYFVRKEFKFKIEDRLEIKTTCMAITPAGQNAARTHAVGIWKIEGL